MINKVEVSGQHHAPAASTIGESAPPRYQIDGGAGWAQEPVWTELRKSKSLPKLPIDSRFAGHPASILATILNDLPQILAHLCVYC